MRGSGRRRRSDSPSQSRRSRCLATTNRICCRKKRGKRVWRQGPSLDSSDMCPDSIQISVISSLRTNLDSRDIYAIARFYAHLNDQYKISSFTFTVS